MVLTLFDQAVDDILGISNKVDLDEIRKNLNEHKMSQVLDARIERVRNFYRQDQ